MNRDDHLTDEQIGAEIRRIQEDLQVGAAAARGPRGDLGGASIYHPDARARDRHRRLDDLRARRRRRIGAPNPGHRAGDPGGGTGGPVSGGAR